MLTEREYSNFEVDKTNLIRQLIEVGAIKFGDFTLSSGKKSKYYVSIKEAITNPDILELYATMSARKFNFHEIQRIIGVPLGGIALAAALSFKTRIPWLMQREVVKEQGLQKQIEGRFKEGMSVLYADDVGTTGRSLIKCMRICEKLGLKPKGGYVLADRQEGAKEAVIAAGFEFKSLITREDLSKYSGIDLSKID